VVSDLISESLRFHSQPRVNLYAKCLSAVAHLLLSPISCCRPSLMAAVYASTLVPLLFGRTLQRQLKPGRLAACSLGSSILFFLITNFAVWQFGSWYSHNWEGLVACFVAGGPFFRYTLTSDLLFSTAIFGTYALALHHSPRMMTASDEWRLNGHKAFAN
jgi:Family of unknown function (DUF6580)